MGSSSERLPSFKGPRDLSLSSRVGGSSAKPNVAGGSGSSSASQARPKRVFTPNIPPKRDRGAPSPGGSVPQSKNDAATSGSRGRGGGRGRGGPRGGGRGGAAAKQRGELVQSESIFSDGVGDPSEAKRTSTSHYKSGYGGNRYKSATEGGSSRISSLNRTTLTTIIKEEDAESDKKIFGNETFRPEEEEDTTPDNPNCPVILPLSNYVPEFFMEPNILEIRPPSPSAKSPASPVASASTSNSNTDTDLIPQVRIKQEKIDEEITITKVKQEKADGEFSEERAREKERLLAMMPLESTSFAHAFRSTTQEGKLLYFQFPDELPILESSVREAVDQQGASKSPSQLVRDIDELPEGFIGRLQILSSGRTRFVIGENYFDVDPGRPVGFRQELYSVDTTDQTLSNLGPVSSKFVLTPDVDYLLRDAL